jgi:LmbE family N-acetylglucosaminyl deacetylase
MKPLTFQLPAVSTRENGEFRRAIARAPRRSLQFLVGCGPLFVLAPHPDDESIGCGGLISACVHAGVRVFVHVLTDGRHSHPASSEWPSDRIAAERECEARRAAVQLGLDPDAVSFERSIDGTLLFDWHAAERIALRVAERVRNWPKPVILAPWRSDPHPDHMAAAVIADLIERAHAHARGLRYLVWAHAGPAGDAIDADRICRFATSRWRNQKRRAIYAHRTQTSSLIGQHTHRLIPDVERAIDRDEIYLMSRAA